jgi:glycosyltransferase involved in cell wall biosynthesis
MVSAIVIFRNTGPFITEAIESVLAQTFNSWELILVDDGSSDGSRQIAETYARRQPGRIRMVEHRNRANRGMSASRNLGVRLARGAYVGFLDADDKWTPEKLMLQVPVLAEDARLGAVIGSIEYFGELPEQSAPVVRPSVPLRTPLDPALLLSKTLLGSPPLLTTLGNPLLRRSALVAVGGFEDEFTGQAEDAVAWCKLALRFPFAALPQTVLRYRRHQAANGALDHRGGALVAGHARFARWLYHHVLRQPEQIRVWALPIVTEHLFRSLVLEAWLTRPDDPITRRARLARTWLDLAQAYPGTMTARRRLRLGAQLVAGLRSGALRRLQEPDVCGKAS